LADRLIVCEWPQPLHDVADTINLPSVRRLLPDTIKSALTATLHFGYYKVNEREISGVCVEQSGVGLKFKARVFSRVRKSNGQDIVFPNLNVAAIHSLVDDEVFNPEISIEPKVPADQKLVRVDFHCHSWS
jgi:hypothetical protein